MADLKQKQKICNKGWFDIRARNYSTMSAVEYRQKHATTADKYILPKKTAIKFTFSFSGETFENVAALSCFP